MEYAFKTWWDGDPDDEPIDYVTKKQAKEIFTAGYLLGSRKPVWQMSLAHYEALGKMIKRKMEEQSENLSDSKQSGRSSCPRQS